MLKTALGELFLEVPQEARMNAEFLDRLNCSLECSNCVMNQRKVQEVLTKTEYTTDLSYDKYEKIFKKGEPIVGFYIVCEGAIREISPTVTDQEVTLRVFKKGDMLFSDSFSAGKECYSTTSECVIASEVIFIHKGVLPSLMRSAGKTIGQKIAQNIVDLRESLEISFHPILNQLTYWLIKLTQNSPGSCSIPSKKLARIIGCSSVTISDKLSWLEERGLVIRVGEEITVPNNRKLLERVMETSNLKRPLESYLED